MRACFMPSTKAGSRPVSRLNAGVLPPDYFALPEQSIRGPVPDVLTLKLSPRHGEPTGTAPGLAVAAAAAAHSPGPAGRRHDLCAQGGSDRCPASAWPGRRRGRDRVAREQGEQ